MLTEFGAGGAPLKRNVGIRAVAACYGGRRRPCIDAPCRRLASIRSAVARAVFADCVLVLGARGVGYIQAFCVEL